jgi:hypothetical protein
MISAIRRRHLAVFLVPALAGCGVSAPAAPAPEDHARAAAMTITAEDIGQKIGVLAHDSMAGRDTPSPELEEAATYLASQLRAAGIQPAGEDGTFIDRYDLTITTLVPEQTAIRVAGAETEPAYGVDYFMVPPPAPVEAPVRYMGVAGEAAAPTADARGAVLVYQHPGVALDQEWQQRLMMALQPAMMSGAAGVLIILAPDFPADAVAQLAPTTAGQQAPIPVVGITHEAGARLIADLGHDLAALEAAGESTALGERPLVITGERAQQTQRPPNVVGMLRGSDPALSDSYIVITAHFDHVGVGAPDETGDSIFNGADDDASGTAAVLELAEAFAALETPPARSVVFLLVSGEEKGLLGSQAWVENPTLDLSGAVANINMDMVGRDPLPDTLIGIGQEYTTIAATLEGILAEHPELGLTVILDPKPEEMYFFRSDQLPFIQRGIPAVFFTTGEHDDYHQPSDEPEAIDADKAARVTRLAFYLAHSIASSATAPEWTEEGRARVREMLGGG